jgi:hypothetical protein
MSYFYTTERGMLSATILLLVLLTSPVLVFSLQCYSCPFGRLNYTLTKNTVPSISTQCKPKNATLCSVSIQWDRIGNTTLVIIDGLELITVKDVILNTIDVYATMIMDMYKKNLLLLDSFEYGCNSSDKCNDEKSLKKILDSIAIDDQFEQEIAPLLEVVSPFDAKTAGCLNFNNYSSDCPRTDLDNCDSCQISVMRSFTFNEKVCASCPYHYSIANSVWRHKTFFLSNRTESDDSAYLVCQLNGCNSLENINHIDKASNITFDFDEFLKN